MKLSEAIRKGSKNTKQAYGTFFEVKRKGKRHKNPLLLDKTLLTYLSKCNKTFYDTSLIVGLTKGHLPAKVYDDFGIFVGKKLA